MKKFIVLLLSITILLSFSACGKSEAVKSVEAEIQSLNPITLESKKAIENAESNYKSLTEEEQRKVSNYSDLETAKESYETLLIDSVETAISSIGNVSIDSKEDIEEAERQYNSLTAEQQKLVGNAKDLETAREMYNSAQVQSVEEKISAIDTKSPERENQISLARLAYESLSAELQQQVANLDILLEAEKPREVTESDHAILEGVYVDDSYHSEENENEKLVYVVFSAYTNDSNLNICGQGNKITFEDTNTYSSEHLPGRTRYMKNYYSSSYIEELHIGDKKGVVATFKVPAAELGAGRLITFDLKGIPDSDVLRLETDKIIYCQNAEEIAQKADPDGYAQEIHSLTDADNETKAKVQNSINGYEWTFYVNSTAYKIEFFESSYSLRTVFGTTSGKYTVKNGYVRCVNDNTGAINDIPYSWEDDGDIDLDVIAGFDVNEY